MSIQMCYGAKVLTGPFTWQGWQKDAGWKSYSADDYSPEDDVLEKLRAVVLKGEKEVGRIVEHPNKSWEENLLDILGIH